MTRNQSRYLMRGGSNAGIIFIMTYNLTFDQEFAVANDLTLVQVTTLAAFMTLPVWTKTIAIDGKVWYLYSDEKMAEDFPLLFGVAKRCYKNVNDLADMGFVELTKLGRSKYVRFTERCAEWGKEKSQICSVSPKSDEMPTENGRIAANNSPKTDAYNNISNNNIIDDNIPAVGGLFPAEPVKEQETKQRGTTEPLCLFVNSKFNRYEDFAACFTKPEFANIDIAYYYNAVADWSAQKGKKMKDWIATARNFMRGDMEKKKLHTIEQAGAGFDFESAKRYLEMGMD